MHRRRLLSLASAAFVRPAAPPIAQVGGTPLVFTPAEFAERVRADTEKWAKVIKLAGIKPE